VQLGHISSVATEALNQVREISHGLRPYQLDQLGLTKAIKSVTSGLSTPARFSMDIDSIDDDIGRDQAIHVYRIVQEGINNILKHAEATEVRITVRREPTAVRLMIADNGKGLPAARLPDGQGQAGMPPDSNVRRGLGLISISERAKAMNGNFQVESTPGRGTTLTVFIPIAKKNA
jgi:signal transduction histidine kinase